MTTYNTDFYTWTQQQAALLRQGCLAELDIPNLLEEIEGMGRGEKRELVNRLTVLLTKLLKWQYQPKRHGRSWRLTIEIQRLDAKSILKESPGLDSVWQECLDDAYEIAIIRAAKETRLDESVFPEICPWTLEKIFDDDFWPEN